MTRIRRRDPDRFEARDTPMCFFTMEHLHIGPRYKDGLLVRGSYGVSLKPKQVRKLYEWLGEWLKRNSA